MSLSFCVLGSGSKGNSTLLRFEGPGGPRHALIDCGLSPRATRARLGALDLGLGDISDIIPTHFDTDHFYPGWVKPIRAHGITVHVHRRHRSIAVRQGLDGRCMDLFEEPFTLDGAAAIDPILFAHDNLGTVGFIIEHDGLRLGYATDLGRVPDGLLERFVNLHALAIESNYDRDLQLTSNRPLFLKRRIMGGRGHLSNEESIEAVLEIAEPSNLSHVVTLHLSEQCNDPRLVQRLYAELAPHLLDKLTISNQRRPTPLLEVCKGNGTPAPGGRTRGRAAARGTLF